MGYILYNVYVKDTQRDVHMHAHAHYDSLSVIMLGQTWRVQCGFICGILQSQNHGQREQWVPETDMGVRNGKRLVKGHKVSVT